MEIISRQEALARGLPRYFTGEPCGRGHVAETYFSGGCVVCVSERQRKRWADDPKHREAQRERQRERRAPDPELHREAQRVADPELHREAQRVADPELHREASHKGRVKTMDAPELPPTAGDTGKIGVSAYAHNKMTPKRVGKMERAVSDWLATAPGSFTSKDAVTLYERAHAKFEKWSGRSDTRDDFEIALARAGFRAGTLVFNGESRWLLILPSSIDTALTRLVALESCPT